MDPNLNETVGETVISIHQPNFMPYPGFFHKMIHSDRFVFLDDVEFVLGGDYGWTNRNQIRLHNKDRHWLSVPVQTKDRLHQTINEVEIINHEPWQKKHWKTIFFNYKQSPHFDQYADELESIYAGEWTRLVDFNLRLIRFFTDHLGITVPTHRSSELSVEGESTTLLANLCEKLDAAVYLSGQHGRDYLDRARMDSSGVQVQFQQYEGVVYEQPYDHFVPSLSTLDLLLNVGGDESRDIIEKAGSFSSSWGQNDPRSKVEAS